MPGGFQLQLEEHEFTGPLDLLLSLVNEQKMSISEISLSTVTEQYMNHLDSIAHRRPGEMADFLVVASRLLFIKSRALLPQLQPELEEEEDLTAQLERYAQFVKASKHIARMWNVKSHMQGRRPEKVIPDNVPMPSLLTVSSIHASMQRLVSRLTPAKPALSQSRIDRTISLKEKIARVSKLLRSKKAFSFSDVAGEGSNKTETIVSFLAILELMKQYKLVLSQKSASHDIMIQSV